MKDPVPLAQALIRAKSVTPAGPAAFDCVAEPLAAAGFAMERLVFGEGEGAVTNLFATKGLGRHIMFAGHVDVVPPGDRALWDDDPFSGAIDGDRLYGRGAQDMKGGLAAMVTAALRWAESGEAGQVSLLITGDEEGPAINGTRAMVPWCAERMRVDGAIVGEPTSSTVLGDTVKVGRRGSLTGTLTVEGLQGHAAYPEKALNPIPTLLVAGQALGEPLDGGTEAFPATNLEIVSIDVGNPADNVIPAAATMRFNVRFCDLWTGESLQQALRERIERVAGNVPFSLSFRLSGEAFRADDPAFVAQVAGAIEATLGVKPVLSTSGGTSDARFIAALCPVVEFGAVGDLMHQANEATSCADLRRLADTYRAILSAALSG